MLVLSRRKNERLIIRTEQGEDIEVIIVNCSPGPVKVGIVADKKINIIRKELLTQTSDTNNTTAT